MEEMIFAILFLTTQCIVSAPPKPPKIEVPTQFGGVWGRLGQDPDPSSPSLGTLKSDCFGVAQTSQEDFDLLRLSFNRRSR